MRIRELGELGVIKELLNIIRDVYPRNSPLELGDDASVITEEHLSSKYLIVKVDGTSITSSKYPWMNMEDLGYRVALSTATDIISKGGNVIAFLISLGIPRDSEVDDIKSLVLGVKELSKVLGAWILGGDTNSCLCNDGWIDVFGLGVSNELISNKFSEGDVVYLTRCLGISAIPAITYYKGLDIRDVMNVVNLKEIVRPEPPTNFLNLIRNVRASTDVSDGLISVTKILKSLGLDLVLNDELPLCKEVRDFMEYFNISIEEIIKYLGEEYVIAFSLKEGVSIKEYPVLGKLVRGSGKVVFEGRVLRCGWDNFRGYLS